MFLKAPIESGAVPIGNMYKAGGGGAKSPLVGGVAGGRKSPQGLAVETLSGGDNRHAPGGGAAGLDGGFHCFGAAICKGHMLKIVRGQFQQAPGQGSCRRHRRGLGESGDGPVHDLLES